jgi:hypothetical protein
MASDFPPISFPALVLPIVLVLPFTSPIASAIHWIALLDNDLGLENVVISLITDFKLLLKFQ